MINLIISPENIEVSKMDGFIVIKTTAIAEVMITLGTGEINPLHDALNHLYEVSANQANW